jgi:hypothetical protein
MGQGLVPPAQAAAVPEPAAAVLAVAAVPPQAAVLP